MLRPIKQISKALSTVVVDLLREKRRKYKNKVPVTRQKGNILSLDGIPYGTFLEN
jgi:hypothetical protein